MATGGHFTIENEYFCRYFRLLCFIGPKPLRKLVLVHVPTGQTLDTFLNSTNNRRSVQTLQNRGILRQYQIDILFPANGNGTDINSWDITLLCTIIKNICNVHMSVKTAIDGLRQERNQLSHGNAALNLADYTTKVQAVCNMMTSIMKVCNDPAFERQIMDEVNNIHTDPLEIQPTIELFQQMIKKDRAVLEHVSDVKEQLTEFQDSMQSFMCTVVKGVDDIKKQTHASAVQNTLNTNALVEIEENRENQQPQSQKHAFYSQVHKKSKDQTVQVPISCSAENHYEMMQSIESDAASASRRNDHLLIKSRQLEHLLSKQSRYVHTDQFKKIEDVLMSTGNVVISGRPGEGKTSAAYELMKKHRQSDKCIQIENPDDINFLEPNMFQFVFIDDLFGQHELDDSKVKLWLPALEKLQHLVNANAFRLIISSREIVLKECEHQLIHFEIFSNKILLSSDNLSDEEKTQILKKSISYKNRTLSANEIKGCIGSCRSDIGFPYLCFLFASNDEFFQERAKFFKTYLVVNNDMLLKLKPSKLWALWYLWVKGNACQKGELLQVSKENMVILKEIIAVKDPKCRVSALLNEISSNFRVVTDVFILDTGDEYSFLHNTIYQSIGLHFAHSGFMERVISSSTLEFFMECFRLKSHDGKSVIFLTDDLYPAFVNRLITEVTERSNGWAIVSHPCITENVLSVLFNVLSDRKHLENFLCPADVTASECIQFLEGILQTGTQESNVFLKRVIAKLKCIRRAKKCNKCAMFYKAFRGACKGGNITALNMLKKCVDIDQKLLLSAVESGNIEVVNLIVKKINLNTIDFEEKQKALLLAIRMGNTRIYKTLRKLGTLINIDCILTAVRFKNIDLIIELAEELYPSNNHDYVNIIGTSVQDNVDDERLGPVLELLESPDVYRLFAERGILPTLDNISSYIRSNKHYLLQFIMWDISSKNEKGKTRLYNKIQNAPQIKKDLVTLGILNKYNYIFDSISNQRSDNVKTLIERQESLNIWNPNEYWVQETVRLTLINASTYTLYRYILQKGYKPTPVALYLAVQTQDIELVQETISKMKTYEDFNSSDSLIKRAVLLSVHLPEMYNLFIKEGVKPSYYHLLFVAECANENSVEVARNVFLALKSEPDIKPNVSVLERVILASIGNDELILYLREESIFLPPYSIVVAVDRHSLKDVEFVINELKMQGYWPPSEQDFKIVLNRCFYMPEIFQFLIRSNTLITHFSILLGVRDNCFYLVKKSVHTVKNEHKLEPNDAVMKLSLLEAEGAKHIKNLLKAEGIDYSDILQISVKSENHKLVAYVLKMLLSNGIDINNFTDAIQLAFENEALFEVFINIPNVCTTKLLLHAAQRSRLDLVKKIMGNLKTHNTLCVEDIYLTKAVALSVNCPEIVMYLLQEGVSPSMDCLCEIIEKGTEINTREALRCFSEHELLDSSSPFAPDVLQKTLMKRQFGVYEDLIIYYGFKPNWAVLCTAVETCEYKMAQRVLPHIETRYWRDNRTEAEYIMKKSLCFFPIYQLLTKYGLRPNAVCVLKAVELKDSNIVQEVVNDFLSEHTWSFSDEYLQQALRKADPTVMAILKLPASESLANVILTTIRTSDEKTLHDLLNSNVIVSSEAIPKILCNYCVFRGIVPDEKVNVLLNHLDCRECEFSEGKVLRAVMHNDLEELIIAMHHLKRNNKWRPHDRLSKIALEEAIYHNQNGMGAYLLESGVTPNSICLFYAIYHEMDALVREMLHMWMTGDYYSSEYLIPLSGNICEDKYLDMAVSLCCKRSDVQGLESLMKFGIFPKTEHLYETIISDNYSEECASFIYDSLEQRQAMHSHDYWIKAAIHYYETGSV